MLRPIFATVGSYSTTTVHEFNWRPCNRAPVDAFLLAIDRRRRHRRRPPITCCKNPTVIARDGIHVLLRMHIDVDKDRARTQSYNIPRPIIINVNRSMSLYAK